MLTQYQSNQIENVQKMCLRCMFGWNKSYQELLQESGLPTLKARRETVIRRFAEKALDNPNYKHWFQPNPNERMGTQRFSKPLLEKRARTARLYNSPIFNMTRILNGTPRDPPAPEVGQAAALNYPMNDPFAWMTEWLLAFLPLTTLPTDMTIWPFDETISDQFDQPISSD